MRKLRIVLKENKNKVLLERGILSGETRQFADYQALKNFLNATTNSQLKEQWTEVQAQTKYTTGSPLGDVRGYSQFAKYMVEIQKLLVDSADGGYSFIKDLLTDEPSTQTFFLAYGSGGSVDFNGITPESIEEIMAEYYKASVVPHMVEDKVDKINSVDYAFATYLNTILKQIQPRFEILKKAVETAKSRQGSGFFAKISKSLMGDGNDQVSQANRELKRLFSSWINGAIAKKKEGDSISKSIIKRGAGEGGGGTGPTTTTPPEGAGGAGGEPPPTTPPEGAGGAGGEPPPAEGEAQELGNNNPVPLFNKGSTSDSLLSAMLMAMNQRIQNNSTDGKGLILSTTDGKKIRLIDAFKNYDKLTPDSKKFVDQIQFIMKDLAGQLKVNGIRIQEAATPILNRTVNPTKRGEKFRTSASGPTSRASGEAGGGLEMVAPVVGSVDVRRAIYRKILRALKVLVDATSTPTSPVFRGDIDKVAIGIADGAAKVAIKFLTTNLSQRGVNVTDKRSKVRIPAKNVGKNYGKKGDPDAGKEKNITLLENKSKLLKEYREHIETKLVPYMQKQIGFNRPPVINFLDDTQNASDPFGKTAFYDPQSMEISVYTTGRHPKDIMRSVAHEVIHHAQNCRGQLDPQRMGEASEGYAQKNPYLRKLEEEAYLLGNMTFRDWEDGMKTNQLNEMHDCNKVHPNKSHAAYKREDKPEKEEKSLDEWRNEERWDLLMKRFNIVSEKRFANDPKLDKDGDGKPKWADEDDSNPKDSKKQVKGKQVKGKK